eukprot:Skav228184  [mRNA]  locus=scaffold3933:319662:320761:+ [translate_table: standard]
MPRLALLVLLGVAVADEMPRSTITKEAVQRFQSSIRARLAGTDRTPDKAPGDRNRSYFGYTTRLLSVLFKRVIALDAVPELLQANREYNSDRDNILYLRPDEGANSE